MVSRTPECTVCEIQKRFLLTCSYLAASFSNSIVSAIQENFKIWLFLVFEILRVAKAAKAAKAETVWRRTLWAPRGICKVNSRETDGNSESLRQDEARWGKHKANAHDPERQKRDKWQFSTHVPCKSTWLISIVCRPFLVFFTYLHMNAYNELLHHCTCGPTKRIANRS